MKGKFLLYGLAVVIISSLMSWNAMLGEAGNGGGGGSSGGSSWRSSGPGSGGFSSGGHK